MHSIVEKTPDAGQKNRKQLAKESSVEEQYDKQGKIVQVFLSTS